MGTLDSVDALLASLDLAAAAELAKPPAYGPDFDPAVELNRLIDPSRNTLSLPKPKWNSSN